MATYVFDYNDPSIDPEVLCDACSTFAPGGFAIDSRSWAPIYGAPCVECGENA